MNIIEYNKQLVANATVRLVHETEEDWTQSVSQKIDDQRTQILWQSEAPGSGAPSSVLAGAIQASQNLGYDVTKAEKLFFEAITDLNNIPKLNQYLSKIFYELNNAPINKSADYWNYCCYTNWQQYEQQIKQQIVNHEVINTDNIKQKIKWGFIGQIAAGAFGTALEGYNRQSIESFFGEVTSYLKQPSTYNDDITFELALLKAFDEHGKKTNSHHIAEQWVALIPFAWSAEDIALKNLRLGIYPPHSGIVSNPYREWIGAQMRGTICGMLAPNNPLLAAKIAWMDGEISHFNNGILGEVFNAVLASLAFEISDIKELIRLAISYIPNNSLYYSVVETCFKKCQELNNEDLVLDFIEEQYQQYNLVHALPNAAIEVVALYFGKTDFTETMRIVAKAGLDVDCNAAQIGNIVGIINHKSGLPEQWVKPLGNNLKTYVRTIEQISISELVDWTYRVYEKIAD
ncbi:ADP-ribosylglycohydrolase family protein [Clostridium sp. 'deep sea']|uniref:ADP-ribosylglycohydrolase family protein n=1 Tax=Clostridium sp. 'deep sea' TaxID=2779445 RepID=UPI0018965B1C|nr:ADP-ribosylglycohydrolase family protein [Clostridium sp. 'deep sea']QOR35386.1 ADP-ribosylglycohydrolase family protein [Clostridium sp. 'deep sea']